MGKYDAANFNKDVIVPIIGTMCFITSVPANEYHHILERGNDFGIRPGDPQRKIFSSPLNAAPLIRAIHAGGAKTHEYLITYLLERAHEKVREAIMFGKYEPTAKDFDFHCLREKWLSEHAPWSWLNGLDFFTVSRPV